MCGLAGMLEFRGPASTVIARRMAGTLEHRGPDGEGSYCDAGLAFAHRRLAVQDLSSAGLQPMASPDGRHVLVYVGEVYNFRELRLELEARGWSFRSSSDTEVVLAALAIWGEEAIPRFNGMFIFAWYDQLERRLRLVRDRYGIKPMYYWHAGGTLLFASEIKAFLEHPSFSPAMDQEALVEYLTFQNFLTDRTLFAGVRMLPQGSILEFCTDREEAPRLRRYWDFRFVETDQQEPVEAYVEELDRLFVQAVSRQLVADVPVGVYLSGGVDTGSVAAVASRQLGHIRTFTVGFDMSSVSGIELAFDERRQAERMSYLFGTEHYEMVVKAGDMERVLPSVVWHLEEPRVGQSYPNFFAGKLASSFGKVVLSGHGGDELFAGYPWRYYRAAGSTDFDDYVKRYYEFWQRLVPADKLPAVIAPLNADARAVDPRGVFREVFQGHSEQLVRPEDFINHSLYFEAKTFLHGMLLVEDKLNMAHGLESRVPFLDNDLVDFAMGVPVGMKLRNLGQVARLNENDPGPKVSLYVGQTKEGKRILRDVLARYVPPEDTDLIKQGFSAPDATWYRGESIDFVRRTLYDDKARIFEFLDPVSVRSLVDDHLSGRENRRLLVWSLLCLEEWCRVWLDGAHPPSGWPGGRG